MLVISFRAPFLELESFFAIFQSLSMNEQDINDLYRRIRNEKIKNLENRKRKASNTGTSVSGSIERKKFKTNEDESDEVQIISSGSHDTQISGDETNEVKIVSSNSNDRDDSNNDVSNELVEEKSRDNNGSIDRDDNRSLDPSMTYWIL